MLGILVVLGLLAAALVALSGVGDVRTPDDGHAPERDATERAVVTRVVDGDTIVVQVDGREERVRYVGVDAPELARDDPPRPAECWGAEARAANERLVEGRTVELERDASDRDRFGRLLRHVWIEGRLAAERLVRDGVVEARSYPPDTGRDAQLEAADLEARDDGAGLWSAC